MLARCSGAAIDTDSNRMELLAVIEGLRLTPGVDDAKSVTVFTDSHYVAHGFTNRLKSTNGKLIKGRGGPDPDLWRTLGAVAWFLRARVDVEEIKRAVWPLNVEADLAAKQAMRSEAADESRATRRLLALVGRALRDPASR